MSENEKSEFEEVGKLIFQIVELKNRLRELGVIRSSGRIVDDYAKWFCSRKFGLELCASGELGYDAVSKLGEKVQIKSKIGSDIDFELSFGEVQVNEFDYLYVVFMNEETWMIDSVYKVSHGVVGQFLVFDSPNSFRWCGESRSLSLQLYPDEDNMLLL